MNPGERFESAVSIVLKHEGGFVNDKDDVGGATNYGISLRFLKAAGIDIDLDGRVNLNDIKKITVNNAKDILKKYWWDKYYYNKINDIEIATKVFDLAVNMGPISAHKILQKALNLVNKSRLRVDGILGKITLDSINKSENNHNLFEAIILESELFYHYLVNKNPALKTYLNGWLNRVYDRDIPTSQSS